MRLQPVDYEVTPDQAVNPGSVRCPVCLQLGGIIEPLAATGARWYGRHTRFWRCPAGHEVPVALDKRTNKEQP